MMIVTVIVMMMTMMMVSFWGPWKLTFLRTTQSSLKKNIIVFLALFFPLAKTFYINYKLTKTNRMQFLLFYYLKFLNGWINFSHTFAKFLPLLKVSRKCGILTEEPREFSEKFSESYRSLQEICTLNSQKCTEQKISWNSLKTKVLLYGMPILAMVLMKHLHCK